ncbi:hypothetical protein [Nocardia transvalensis]|uniref:hypothetical protein n=1 Tax=Nocardia transvalensis TaxID=37333 RepID=UPI0018945134|nr:hypothetical protein [Nocardia transvalensis]MBF6329534.1 hypothetical protein [Nocardia transvalensis]
MIARKLAVGGMLCAASLFIAAPMAQAGTGSSSLSSQIDVGCILQSLSGEPPTADCKPPQIPVSGADDGGAELAIR